MAEQPPDIQFTRRLPKAELHAHLSGSITRETLHEIWLTKPNKANLPDPLLAITPGEDFVDITSFFQLFDTYIYNLITTPEDLTLSTTHIIHAFASDGTTHLELRTTPRPIPSRAQYVHTINTTLQSHPYQSLITVTLILTIDRKMSPTDALEIVTLAHKHQHPSRGSVTAIDLAGNPSTGPITKFTPAFHLARRLGLNITVHCAETPSSATPEELETILSWSPDRLGHVIHVPPACKRVIEERGVGVELCLSCNVLGKLTTGGYEGHHFGEWWATRERCPVALSTDDVGVFGSSLSNEYLLAAQHFNLSRQDLIELSRSAARSVFSGRDRLEQQIRDFELQEQSREKDQL